MSKQWTPERRAQQAEFLRTLKPWLRSTGPRTDAGKARSARNAYKGGVRVGLRHVGCLLNDAIQCQLAAVDSLRERLNSSSAEPWPLAHARQPTEQAEPSESTHRAP